MAIKRVILFVLKLAVLGWLCRMALIQVPELRYDLGSKTPVTISDPARLTPANFPQSTFVSVAGMANFDKSFIYRRYGLSYTYFNVDPYGTSLVVRTYEKVTDEWKNFDRFVGKLRTFERQPFSYRIAEIYGDKFGVALPRDTMFLALYDVPEPSGWQIGALIFNVVLGVVLCYLFFFRRPRKSAGLDAAHHEDKEQPDDPPQDKGKHGDGDS